MKILCITHADFESPGVIEQWALNNNYEFKIERPYKNEKLSEVGSFDFLIIMGGPQSPSKLNEFPYLAEEIDLIKQAILQDKKILGFCLGAQLIGEAFGAKTEKSPEKEIGVFSINITKEGAADPLLKELPESFTAIHWHNDMPGLNESAKVLAASIGCPRQIVKYKNNVYGFQCHLEITLDGIRDLIEAVPEDLAASKYTQSEEKLLMQDYKSINDMMIIILDRFTKLSA